MLAMWAAWSFYKVACVDWPLAFHDGGGLTRLEWNRMARLFPSARLVGREMADKEVEASLAASGFNYLLQARRRNVMIRKLVDFTLLGRSPRFISCDSDVLFFQRPDRMIELANGMGPPFGFNRDSHNMYSINLDQAMNWFGLAMPEKINAGLGVLTRAAADLGFLNKAFGPGLVPADKDVFPEQTACALLVARSGEDGILPDAYSVATGTSPLDLKAIGAVSRHYVGPVRHLFFDEGLPALIRVGGLKK